VETFDAVIVGGGPAGSACAERLVDSGARVLVLDREPFPRTKLCAGWITPEVVDDLRLDLATYPHRLNTFERIVAHVKTLRFSLKGPQHSIRRHEFDHFLLERSGAPVRRHTVRAVRREGRDYVIDDAFRCRHLVGAGGTRCPVYREIFRHANPRARQLQAATLEQEFPYDWHAPECHLWFFDRGLPGYAWYVPKADGYLNLGLGGMAETLKARGGDLRGHWRHFIGVLEKRGLVAEREYAPKGYSYYLRGNVDVVRIDDAFLTGDAAGLATRDLCEGIGPAVRSGHRAAAAITRGVDYALDDLPAFSSNHAWVRGALEYVFARRRPVRAA
jgi:flavin-dependent dehydrogenase